MGRQRRSGPSMSDWGCWAGLVPTLQVSASVGVTPERTPSGAT